MIKVEVIENFTLEDYNKLKNVKKVISRKENEFGARDTFECDEKMVDYLTGNNALNKVVVKVIEVEPEIVKTNDEIKVKKDNVEIVINKNEIVKEIKKQSKKKKSSKK
jgi:hypothetical protein